MLINVALYLISLQMFQFIFSVGETSLGVGSFAFWRRSFVVLFGKYIIAYE